jgi:hypothetical protein
MISLKVSELIEANIWIDELPQDVQIIAERFRSNRIEASSRRHDTIRIVIELLKCLGPRQSHGLLGILFSESNTTQLSIEVLEECQNTGCYDSSLLHTVSDEDVIIGLPEWAIEPVISTIIQYPRINQLGSGRLAVDCCAFGTRSSNVHMFRVLTTILLDCLFIPRLSEKSEETLLGVLRHRIA